MDIVTLLVSQDMLTTCLILGTLKICFGAYTLSNKYADWVLPLLIIVCIEQLAKVQRLAKHLEFGFFICVLEVTNTIWLTTCTPEE